MTRKRLRLLEFDYSSNGAYFLTICSHDRRALFFGDAKTDIENELTAIADRFPGATVDESIVMADHVHAILSCLTVSLPFRESFRRSSRSQQRLKARGVMGRIWQRGYYDRIVRNEIELGLLREYIHLNPLADEIKREGEG